MLIKFRSTTYDDPMKALTRLRQPSIVAMYKREFEVLSNRIKGLSPQHKLSCFLSGLKDEVRLPMRILNPLLSLQHLGSQKSKKSTCWDARRVTRGNLSRLGLPCLVYLESLPQFTLGTKF